MTLSLGSRVIGSAHHLTETNIWVKLNDNPSNDSGDMEQTQKFKGKSHDCDLESKQLGYVLCTLSH